jgi:hypothetical protein
MITPSQKSQIEAPEKKMSKTQLILTLDAFVELYSRRVAEMPELQEDIDAFKDMSAQLKATL